MAETTRTSVIITAEDLRKMVDDENNDRKKELEEAASFILEFIDDFIRRHANEIVSGGKEYPLSSKDIEKVCGAKGKPLIAPSTLKEFDVFINIITDTLSDNGYKASITTTSPPGDNVAISISA